MGRRVLRKVVAVMVIKVWVEDHSISRPGAAENMTGGRGAKGDGGSRRLLSLWSACRRCLAFLLPGPLHPHLRPVRPPPSYHNGRSAHVSAKQRVNKLRGAASRRVSSPHLLLLTGLTSGNAPAIYSGRFVVITGITGAYLSYLPGSHRLILPRFRSQSIPNTASCASSSHAPCPLRWTSPPFGWRSRVGSANSKQSTAGTRLSRKSRTSPQSVRSLPPTPSCRVHLGSSRKVQTLQVPL